MVTGSFPHTRAALVKYDRHASKREAQWKSARTNEEVEACSRAGADALNEVRDAFYQDTQEINSREHCNAKGIYHIRRMASARR